MDWRIEKEKELLEEIRDLKSAIDFNEKSVKRFEKDLEVLNNKLTLYMKKEGYDNANIGRLISLNTYFDLEMTMNDITDISILKHLISTLKIKEYIKSDTERIKKGYRYMNDVQEKLNQLNKYGRIIA